jgi:hypothetical protein
MIMMAINNSIDCFEFHYVAQDIGSNKDESMSETENTGLERFLELLQQNLLEINVEKPPAGTMCPIRSICPDRGWKNLNKILRNEA